MTPSPDILGLFLDSNLTFFPYLSGCLVAGVAIEKYLSGEDQPLCAFTGIGKTTLKESLI